MSKNSMILALDESGTFHVDKKTNKISNPSYVVGFIYEYPDAEDLNAERHRIIEYLKILCSKSKVKYPAGLHKRDNNTKSSISRNARKSISYFIKSGRYSEGLSIRSSTGYKIPPRKGQYRIFASLANSDGKHEYLDDSCTFLINDTHSTNLYVHMVQDLLLDVLFHNPLFKVSNINLLIAERGSSNLEAYQTFISREVLRMGIKDTVISSVSCLPIAYEPDKKSTSAAVSEPYKKQNMPFLYLADILCYSLHTSELLECTIEKEKIKLFYSELKKISNNNPLLKGYSDVDTYYANSWNACKCGNYFQAISLMYDGMHTKDSFGQYYNDVLFPAVPALIRNDSNAAQHWQSAIDDLDHYANNKQEINPDKLKYIYEIFESMISENRKLNDVAKYKFYTIGQSVYNHIGDPRRAYDMYMKTEQIEYTVPMEMTMLAKRQMTVSCQDTFDSPGAYNYCIKALELYESIRAIRNKYSKHNPLFYKDVEYGRILSQLGQVYAQLGKSDAKTAFERALNEFNENDADYYRTLSYLAHHYIEQRDFISYSKTAQLLFGNMKGSDRQYEWLLDNAKETSKNFTFAYLLYVYVKAQYVFFPERIDSMPDFAKDCADRHILRKEHPWEILFKYFAMIEYQKEEKHQLPHKYSNQLMSLSLKAVKLPGYSISAVTKYGQIQFMLLKGEDASDLILNLYNDIHECHTRISVKKAKDFLDKHFIYMYA